MPLSWNEIKSRAVAFSKEWSDVTQEEAEAKPFLIEFLNIFGVTRKRVATFEHKVKKLNEGDGYIDLLWKGMLLVEMKSTGKDLEKAYIQAKDYCAGLKEYELPKLILISDFKIFHLYNEDGEKFEFELSEIVKHVSLFGLLASYEKRTYKEQDPVNIRAAELMGLLHDKLKSIGYTGHNLELYLVRLLFCLFADDTGIFDRGIMLDYLMQKTSEDGSDLALHLEAIFSVLNTPEPNRLKTLDENLRAFPYVNGKLFEERLPLAAFDSEMRNYLLRSCSLDWGKISPAIFGSLFQSVMDEKQRRNLGAHYTSETNILKLIKPLFLDELWNEFHTAGKDKTKLKKLHEKISKLKFLDPACGCGNFLIIAYRELRLLELEIIKIILHKQTVTSINDYFLIDVDQFYGIEYEEFPSQIAQVAMWLIDHQMNQIASVLFGEYYIRIPLKKSATIVHGNALRLDWQTLLIDSQEDISYTFNYIFGNPPFIGKNFQTTEQKKDIELTYGKKQGVGNVDYVTAWYIKSAQYLRDYQITKTPIARSKVAFVSTNSITQGEQVGILWSELFLNYNIKIHFAHKTFKWGNEARANAAVHVIIIGFSNYDTDNKIIYEYENISGEPLAVKVKNINAYLIDAKDGFLMPRTKPLCNVPEMINGSKVVDGGNLILTETEKEVLISSEPKAEKFIRLFIGSDEFINNEKRYCLWLKNITPEELRDLPLVKERVEKVRKMRQKSVDKNTQKWANFPTLFMAERQPDNDYLIIPRVSSENRVYIPIGYLNSQIIISDRATALPNASLYIFGIITSIMHMTWMKYTCGRLESRYNYSNSIVYNNFPWPENPSEKLKIQIEKASKLILDTRAKFKNSTLGDLYDPNLMPPELIKAHLNLDRLVDSAYRKQPFQNELKRIEFLFDLYDTINAGIFAPSLKKVKRRKIVP